MEEQFEILNKSLESKILTLNEYFFLVCQNVYKLQLPNIEKHKLFMEIVNLSRKPLINVKLIESIYPDINMTLVQTFVTRHKLKTYDNYSEDTNGNVYISQRVIHLVLVFKDLYQHDKFLSILSTSFLYYNKLQLSSLKSLIVTEKDLVNILEQKLIIMNKLESILDKLASDTNKKREEKVLSGIKLDSYEKAITNSESLEDIDCSEELFNQLSFTIK
jgi:hypothetical protein